MKIDPEFRSLIPPLLEAERAQLEDNLAANGCRDPLVLWRGFLIDGHNRYEICERLGIKYQIIEIALASRPHVLLWIEENQLGRRNLPDDQRAAIADSVRERRAKLAVSERNKRNRRGKTDVEDNAAPMSARTRPAVAKAARISERKLRAIREIREKDIAAFERIRAGETTIQQERSVIRRAERIDKIAALAAAPPLPEDRQYPILLIDPPWKYEFAETENRAIENQYPTMTLDELRSLPVSSLASADALLFLWATNPKLAEAIELVKAWGFEYRTNIVWVKDKIGMGYYARAQHELLLIAKRGELPAPEPFNRPSSVIQAPRGEHSEKPAVVYELIERMYSGLPKIELFARGEHSDQWDVWGNQANDAKTASGS